MAGTSDICEGRTTVCIQQSSRMHATGLKPRFRLQLKPPLAQVRLGRNASLLGIYGIFGGV